MSEALRCPYCSKPVEAIPTGSVVTCSACGKSFPRASAHDTLPSNAELAADLGETLPASAAPSSMTQTYQAKQIGPYVLGSILGKGVMGAVFRATDNLSEVHL